MKTIGKTETTWTTYNELKQTRMYKMSCWQHLRKDSANVRCITLRRTKRNTAWEGKRKGWVTAVTQPPQMQPDEITESIVDGRLQKEKRRTCSASTSTSPADRCVLFTATSNHLKPSKTDLNILQHRQQLKTHHKQSSTSINDTTQPGITWHWRNHQETTENQLKQRKTT